MAIRMMCEASTPGAVKDDYWSGVAKTDIFLVTTHEGVVCELREINGYDDSDFYAVVWNQAKGEPERVTYASTRGWTYPNGAAVDATPEVAAKYVAYLEAQAEAARAAAAAREAKGKAARTVRNVRGKSAIEAGVDGVIVWVGVDKFSGKGRVGFKAKDGRTVFIAANAVEVVTEETNG
jgi:hypothetical protein